MNSESTRRNILRTMAGTTLAGMLLGTASSTAAASTTAEELWRETSSDPYEYGVSVVDGVAYVGKLGLAMGFDVESGERVMRSAPGDDLSSTSAPAKLVDGTYYYEGSSTFVALDPDDGSAIAEYTTSDSDAFDTFFDAGYADGEMYVTGTGGPETNVLAAIDIESGEERHLAEPGSLSEKPVVVGDTVYVGANNRDPVYLYAFDRDSGEERWRAEGTDSFGLDSAPAVVGDTVYACGQSRTDTFGWIAALDVADGSESWRHELDGRPSIDPTVVDGVVYVGVQMGLGDDLFLALDAETGDVRWKYESQAERETGLSNEAAPTVADGVVYITDQNGTVVGLDAETGEETWEADVSETIESSPIVVDGVLYVTASSEPDGGTTDDGHVVAVDAAGDGSSRDSRVLQGTYNHHGGWSGDASAYADLLQEGPVDSDGGDSGDGGGDDDDDGGSSDDGSPGFGVIGGLAALFGTVEALRRRS